MKQKIVITLSTVNNEKSRRKALKTAVSQAGVESAALKGTEKNQIEVIGDRIDAAQLTTLLRKKVGYADLSTVNPVNENKNPATVPPTPSPAPTIVPCPYPVYQRHYCEYQVMNHEPSCNIL